MKANRPSGYVEFINQLWMRRRRRFEHDWVCTQPLASTDPAAPEQTTKLHEYQDILARIGASVAVAKIARKAWKTPVGQKAINAITLIAAKRVRSRADRHLGFPRNAPCDS